MNDSLFTPELFPHHSWGQNSPTAENWVHKLEGILDWLMGIDE